MIDESLLPPMLQELADLIGPAATLRLVDQYGGLEIEIPTRFREDMMLSKVVGRGNAMKLVCRYGGCRIYIAKCQQALIAARNAEILARYEAGESPRALAREYGLTERWVWQIIREMRWRREEGQGDLFGEG